MRFDADKDRFASKKTSSRQASVTCWRHTGSTTRRISPALIAHFLIQSPIFVRPGHFDLGNTIPSSVVICVMLIPMAEAVTANSCWQSSETRTASFRSVWFSLASRWFSWRMASKSGCVSSSSSDLPNRAAFL